MKKIIWDEEAWRDFDSWLDEDRKTVKRIRALIKDILRSPYEGIGKPEPLKHDLQGYWSRRIDETNRLVYRVESDKVLIAQCKAHY